MSKGFFVIDNDEIVVISDHLRDRYPDEIGIDNGYWIMENSRRD